jgi:hypothetical protein
MGLARGSGLRQMAAPAQGIGAVWQHRRHRGTRPHAPGIYPRKRDYQGRSAHGADGPRFPPAVGCAADFDSTMLA